MDASRGSIKLTGRLVRKSLFGSMLDPMLASIFQRGAKRAACSPATITQRNPTRRMIRMMTPKRMMTSDITIASTGRLILTEARLIAKNN